MTRLESFPHPAFPLIPPGLLMTIPDIAAFLPQPKGAPIAQHTARTWLPVNEQLAVQLGHAQRALHLLDDQRAIVTSVMIYPDLVLIDLLRAPDQRKAEWQHIDVEGSQLVVTADLAGADQTVLLRWPLEG